VLSQMHERPCPSCRRIDTSRSRRHGLIERYLLSILGMRPFRCLNCDGRFYAFSRFDAHQGNVSENPRESAARMSWKMR
jgi:hypothetical protein